MTADIRRKGRLTDFGLLNRLKQTQKQRKDLRNRELILAKPAEDVSKRKNQRQLNEEDTMRELKPVIYENGIQYVLVGDYYIPVLKLPEEHRPIGHWGRLHQSYLK